MRESADHREDCTVVPGRRLRCCAFFLFAAAWLLCACSKPRPPVLSIAHVTLIDATGAAAQPDMTVVVWEQRISAIGRSADISLPRGAHVVEGRGKFLIPGLADMHVHLTGAGEPGGSREFMVPLLLANGITTVQDMGGYLESLVPLRTEIREGKRLGPQIFFAGPYLDGSPPSFQPSFVVTNAVEASEDVHTLVGRGVDFIKVQSHLSRDAYFAIAKACAREHVTFVGHVPDRVTAAEASDTGQKSIEHLTNVMRGCSKHEERLMREQFFMPAKKKTAAQSKARMLAWQKELLRSFSEEKEAELFDEFVRNQTWQVPTLILLKNNAFPTPSTDVSHDDRRKYVPRQILEGWDADAKEQDKGVGAAEFELRKELMEKSLQLVGRMNSAGVKIMAGTDTAAPFVFPGSSLHEELALLVQAGLTPMQALQTATKNPAEFLGNTQERGTIEVEKFADLVLLDADPMEDIHNTQRIGAVVVRGQLTGRSDLDSLLAAEATFAAK